MEAITKKSLKEGNVFNFVSEVVETGLEVFYTKPVQGWESPFRLIYNGEFHSYKTFKGLMNKAKYFIDKYHMNPIEGDLCEN